MKYCVLCVLASALVSGVTAFAAPADGQPELDSYGGLKSLNFGAGSFFRTHYDGQRWWIVTPEGGAFFSVGINNINSNPDTERGTGRQPYREGVLTKHGSLENWASATRDRLNEWGVNTLGGWSTSEVEKTPYTVVLSVAGGLWGQDTVPDFFAPEVQARMQNNVAGLDAKAADPFLVGYFLDNELPWSFDWRRSPDVFQAYVAMAEDTPGKGRLVAFFKERYETIERFNAVWNTGLKEWSELAALRHVGPCENTAMREDRDAFTLIVARQYFKTATEAVKAKDPNHLLLGCRLVWALAPAPVIKACGEFCDVVSINYYEAGWLGTALLGISAPYAMRVRTDLTFKDFYDLAQKPLLISEFSFRSMDSGMPNTFPPGSVVQPTVKTQRDRADRFERCATTWATQPHFVGYHWFEYADEPKGGRFDGEDGNYGVVNLNDDPYPVFIDRFESVNHHVWTLHTTPPLPR